MNFMSNGLAMRKSLGADIADAERAERAPDEADAHVLGALGEAVGRLRASARSLVISLPVSASMRVMIETATGRRTPSGVMTSAMPASVQASTSTVS